MGKKNDHIKHATHTKKLVTDSALQKFAIGFEYDRTWAEAKHSVQLRPLK